MPGPNCCTTCPVGRLLSLLVCWTLITNLTCQVRAQLDNETSPTHQFKSRPDLHAPILDIAILQPELVAPGYIFLAPYRNVDPGPYIYDNFGNLVWSGAGQSGPKTAHTPRVCQYRGRDHLCFFQGEQHQGFARGHGVIMDQSYRVVKTIESSGAGASADMHEFKMTPYSEGKTVLMTVYQPRQYDFTANAKFKLQHGLGWIVEGVFQEVDIETGRLLFEWRSLDHVDPSQAWTLPSSTDTSGDGLHEESPWDYFHINSIDKNIDGDYLISARHVSAIYKVSRDGGHILWQLGGNRPDFMQTNFRFSYQHHARWISENSTHTVLSFFDNASNSYNTTGEFSHGWVIAIDHTANTATMIKEWGAPMEGGGLLSSSQGNLQLLPTGGCHIGWGEHAYFSEHTADGQCVQFGRVAQRASNVMIYRSNKYNWTAQPVSKPALWAYSKLGLGDDGPLNAGPGNTSFWVSWNGATEVNRWSFYAGNTASGPWTFVGSAEKDGFETEFHLARFAPWSYATALDKHGTPLSASVTAKTFVPSKKLRIYCHDRGCDYNERVDPEVETPYLEEALVDEQSLSPNRGFDTDHYYQELPGVENDFPSPMDVGEPTPQRGQHYESSGIAKAAGAGALFGFTAAAVGILVCLYGGFRKLHGRAMALAGGVTSAAFGARTLGRYTRVRDTDSFGSASSVSSSDTWLSKMKVSGEETRC